MVGVIDANQSCASFFARRIIYMQFGYCEGVRILRGQRPGAVLRNEEPDLANESY
jgi:hypothetical protein